MSEDGMRFRLLGACEAQVDGRPVDLGAPKQVALLARLLLEAPRPVSVDRLIDDLWAGDPPARATASLQAYVSNLRRALEPDRAPRAPASVLVTRASGYLLRVEADDVDVARFEASAARATHLLAAGDAAGALDVATSALALWRGPALLDVREERFAAAAVARLEDLRLSVEEVRLAAALDLGRDAEVAAQAEALVADEPLRERLWELLVLALYRGGRPAAALARYRRYRELLDTELGLEPGPRLQELELAVLRHDPSLQGPAGPASAAPVPSTPVLSTPVPSTPVPSTPVPSTPVPSTPVPALAAPPDAPAPAREDRVPAPTGEDGVPLLGRDDLLATLTPALTAPQPAWVLLTGEAGIGKTRLAEALAEAARRGGAGVAVARAHEDPDTPPYWLWSQVLRALQPATREGGAGTGTGEDLLGSLADAATASGTGDSARFVLYDALRATLADAARTRPLMLVLDDLQWADGDSLRALRFLAVHLRDAPVSLVATVRDGEDWPVFAEVLEHVARRPGARRVAVPPLDVDAVRALVTAVGAPGARDLGGGDDLARALHARSGGNAFFATELARLAAAGGRPQDSAGDLPDGVRQTVARRLDRLPDAVRDALRLTAVTGADADIAVLARAAGLDVAAMLDQLDPALATGLLLEDGDGLRVRFGHALTRETLLSELTPARRRRLHAQVAAALTGTAGPELAHHLLEAVPLGDPVGAVDAAQAQARLAARRLAYDEAARWCTRALAVLAHLPGPTDPRRRHHLLLTRADAAFHAGQVSSARRDLVDALLAAADVDDLDAVAEAAAALSATGGVWTWVDLAEVPYETLAAFGDVLARLRGRDCEATVRLLGLVATGHYYAPDARELTDTLSAEAVAMARRLGEPRLLADALLDRGFALRLPDHPGEVVALADEALALPGLTAVQRMIAHGRRYYGLLHLGDLVAAEEACRRARDLADAERLRGPQLQMASFPIGMAAARGRFDEAEELSARAWQVVHATEMPVASLGLLGVAAATALYRGRMPELVPALREAVEQTELKAMYHDLAVGLATAGDTEGALAYWRRSLTARTAPWMEVVDAAVEVEVLEWIAAPGSPLASSPEVGEARERLLAVLAPRADAVAAAGTAFAWCPVAVPLGVLHLRLGRLDDAERHLRTGLARSRGWGTHVWTARAARYLADVLDARGSGSGSGSGPAEAAALRAEAHELAAELGIVLPG